MGRLSADKGFFRFLGAILYLLNENSEDFTKFRIISPKQDIKKMSNSLKTYLLKLGIVIKEYIDEPLSYYASTKLIVLPTTYGEGLSRVALESAFLGLPVAAIHNRGISSLFMDGMLGEATMEQEPYGIARIIKKICDSYSEYENGAKNNRLTKIWFLSTTINLLQINSFQLWKIYYEKKFIDKMIFFYRTYTSTDKNNY